MNRYKTPQEEFWAGEFGTNYIERNTGDGVGASNVALFSQILRTADRVQSVLEIGANIGLNLRTLHSLRPDMEISAVEINARAVAELRKLGFVETFHQSAANFECGGRHWDLVFTKGVLIHLHPDLLPAVYDKMVAASARYVMLCEYYNPTPVAVEYRGHSERLFKRDFAGEMMERHPCLELVDYRFIYRRDPVFAQDDCTWFLMEKREGKEEEAR